MSWEGSQRISSRPSPVSAWPWPPSLQLCPVLTTSSPSSPFPGSWHVRLKGTVVIIKASTPKSSSLCWMLPEMGILLLPQGISSIFAFYPDEICLLQQSPPAHLGLSPSSMGQPFRCLSLTPPGEVLIKASVSQKRTNPKGI